MTRRPARLAEIDAARAVASKPRTRHIETETLDGHKRVLHITQTGGFTRLVIDQYDEIGLSARVGLDINTPDLLALMVEAGVL